MTIRLSATLIPGVCAVCVATSPGPVTALPTVARQPTHSATGAISPHYALAASSTAASSTIVIDALNVATLPLQNLITISTAVGGLTNILILPNTIYGLAISGRADQIPAAIASALLGSAATTSTDTADTAALAPADGDASIGPVRDRDARPRGSPIAGNAHRQ